MLNIADIAKKHIEYCNNELNKNRLKTLSTDDVGLIVEKTMCEYYLTNFCKNKAKGEIMEIK